MKGCEAIFSRKQASDDARFQNGLHEAVTTVGKTCAENLTATEQRLAAHLEHAGYRLENAFAMWLKQDVTEVRALTTRPAGGQQVKNCRMDKTESTATSASRAASSHGGGGDFNC